MSGWSNLGLGKIRLGQVWDWVGLSLGEMVRLDYIALHSPNMVR